MFGCSVPRRCGTSPETQDSWWPRWRARRPACRAAPRRSAGPRRWRRDAAGPRGSPTAAYMPHIRSAMPTPTFIGGPSAAPGEAHDPAQALRQIVVAGARGVGAGLAEAGDRAVDQPRELGAQLLVAQAVAGEVADLEILDQHVAAGQQAPDQGLALAAGDVDRDRALVAVGAEIVGALRGRALLALDVGRPPFAGVVAGTRPLDLDDVGAEVAQQLRAARARQDPGQVQHANPSQRLRRRHPRPSPRSRLSRGHRP